MSDIATVFHWTPRDMCDFTLVELAEWRERARMRSATE
jgi:Phage P2 GpE